MSGRVQIFHNKQITSPVNPLPVTVISGGGVGGLTDTELRASPVPVSLTSTTITGSVALAAGTANIGDVDVLTLPPIPAGTNNIGDVDVLSLPALPTGTNNIGDVDILTIAAGTTRVGGTYDVGGQLIDEVPTVRTVNRAFVNASATGNTSLVAAQGVGVRIRVLGIIAVSTLANNVKFQSATTDISALFPLAANAGFVLPETAHGWFQTAANEALNVNLSAATATGVQVIWVQAT